MNFDLLSEAVNDGIELKRENKQLKQENEKLKEHKEMDYKSRIEKAVEFINEYCKYNKITINGNKYYDEYILNNVIDILNGRSDE